MKQNLAKHIYDDDVPDALEQAGTHPFGTVLGALAGALLGALVGLAAGPVGSLACALGGAVLGGLLGSGRGVTAPLTGPAVKVPAEGAPAEEVPEHTSATAPLR